MSGVTAKDVRSARWRLLSLPASVPSSITLWRVDRGGDFSMAADAAVVTAEDWMEISRLRGEARARGFAVRAMLRHALSAAVEQLVAPEAWRFERTAYGKLVLSAGQEKLDFSISHAGETSCIAVSVDGRVGLDIARSAVQDWHSVAEHFFSHADQRSINAAPPEQRETQFLRLWTAKEAFAKLLGVGLAMNIPANDCGFGTQLASWVLESPSGDLSVSLAFDDPVEEGTARRSAGMKKAN
jgi:4'-phosphopantetheinyl transferase